MQRVDVVLPTRNRPLTLPWSIRSALGQTESSLRLHVVSHGGNLANEAVAGRLDDGRVSFSRVPAEWPWAKAINSVLRACTAPYVAYLTDDDLWFPDHLARGLALLDAGQVDFVAFRPACVRYPDEPDPYLFAFDWQSPLWRCWWMHRFMGLEYCIHRRELLDRIGYWDESIARFADNEFYNRARRLSRRARYVDVITVLRFYARDWNRRYAGLAAPPQRRYLALLQDEGWRERLREDARSKERPIRARLRQASEFTTLGLRAGIPFLRHLMQLRQTGTRVGSRAPASGAEGTR